jgi:DNA-binding NarL/FixJ family response regulator
MNPQLPATKSNRIRILIVDDDRAVRYATRQWLEMCTRFEVVAEAADGVEAVCAVGEYLPDIVLMDISMPSMNGLEATAWLSRRFPQVRVIIHTGSTDTNNVRKAFEAGAAAYLAKASYARLAFVIDEVAAGRPYLDLRGPLENPGESDSKSKKQEQLRTQPPFPVANQAAEPRDKLLRERKSV